MPNPSISAHDMRDAWKRRCLARSRMNASNKILSEYDDDERAAHRENSEGFNAVTAVLIQGLRERGGMFWLTPDFPLVIDENGDMVPVWPWMQSTNGYGRPEYARNLIESAKRRMAEHYAAA